MTTDNPKYYIPDHEGTLETEAVCYKYYIGDELVAGFIDDKEHMSWYDVRLNACGSTLSDINGTFEAAREFGGVIENYMETGYPLTVREFRLPEDTDLAHLLGTAEQPIADAILGIWKAMYLWLTDLDPVDDPEFYAQMVGQAKEYWDISLGHAQ